jgi:hypothetical protein
VRALTRTTGFAAVTRLAPPYADAKPYVVEERSAGSWTGLLVDGYRFFDEHGCEIFQKLKYAGSGEKSFRYRWYDGRAEAWRNEKPRGVKPGSADADAYLYRLPELLATARRRQSVVWCEGEKDADSVAAVMPADWASVAHHGGAGKIFAEQAAWLEGRHQVYVVVDNDVPGHYDALLRYEALRAVGVRRIGFRLGQVGNDITDHLNAGLPLRQWRKVCLAEIQDLADQYTESVGLAHGYGK